MSKCTNCIYVLTCPCGQFDFVGESKGSFAETLSGQFETKSIYLNIYLPIFDDI